MRKFICFCIALILFFSGSENLSGQAGLKDIIYAGTSPATGSKALYVLEFDRSQGKLRELQIVTEGTGPGFLALSPDKKFLYSIYGKGTGTDGNGSIMSFKIDPATSFLTKLNEQSTGGKGPAHLSIDPKGRYAYVSNYGEGTVAVLPINKDGSLAGISDYIRHTGKSIHPARQQRPYPHSTIPSSDGKFIYVSDLGTDKIMIYQVLEGGKLKPAITPFAELVPGSGPRHFKFHPKGRLACSVSELSSTISVFSVNKKTGALSTIERLSMLPEGYKETSYASDVHFSPDGKFVYASNRGHESLVIFKVDQKTGRLSLVGHENTGGKHPRNFMIDRKGEFVLVGNTYSDNVVVFKRDKQTGKLTPNGMQYTIPAVTCLIQL